MFSRALTASRSSYGTPGSDERASRAVEPISTRAGYRAVRSTPVDLGAPSVCTPRHPWPSPTQLVFPQKPQGSEPMRASVLTVAVAGWSAPRVAAGAEVDVGADARVDHLVAPDRVAESEGVPQGPDHSCHLRATTTARSSSRSKRTSACARHCVPPREREEVRVNACVDVLPQGGCMVGRGRCTARPRNLNSSWRSCLNCPVKVVPSFALRDVVVVALSRAAEAAAARHPLGSLRPPWRLLPASERTHRPRSVRSSAGRSATRKMG